MSNYKGLRWYKCDFHLHTPSSECFEDKTVTADKWVKEAISKKLNCVAVTDHNTGNSIDEIIESAKETSLIVFPGVEITCDTSKIHLLILFDVNKNSQDVNDFLIKCDIDRDKFGKQDAYTTKNIIDVVTLANDNGCIIIPAHIDEYNGLGSVSNSIIDDFYKLPFIKAVQFVHEKFLDTSLRVDNNEELKSYFDNYYGCDIDYSTIKDWQKPLKKAIETKKALLTFSDNPYNESSSHHGLWGIGSKYSWIKMEENPTLESLRQSFLLPELRIRNFYDNPNNPYTVQNLWIKSISINKTEVTQNTIPFKVDFSPQLTTIIGGRGSGKSSILRFLRGAFSKAIDSTLQGINEDQIDFYKIKDKVGKGVLTKDSVLEIIFIRNSIEYKINVTNLNGLETNIKKFNDQTAEWEVVTEDGFIEFFEFEHYSQKQIYEIAQKPNSLRERIDSAIESMDVLKKDRDVLEKTYLAKSAEIRTIQKEISGKGKLKTELKDITDQIELYNTSKISELIKKRTTFIENKKEIKDFQDNLLLKEEELKEFIEEFNIPTFSDEKFEEEYKVNISNSYTAISKIYLDVKSKFTTLHKEIEQSKENFMTEIKTSNWNVAFGENNVEFKKEKERLNKLGLSDIENFEKLTQEKLKKEQAINLILKKEEELRPFMLQKITLHNEYILKLEEISTSRKEFVSLIIMDDKVKVKINTFRNKDDFELSLRKIIQRDNGFYDDIEKLQNICFNGLAKTKMIEFRSLINNLRNNEDVNGISGHFKNVIIGLTDAQVDTLMLLMPEDAIEVEYRSTVSSPFKSLSTASAGQKTTAILTFILSYGNNPLILDQPEDDLDNRLVYDLIVHKLKQTKEKRQIIIVTHNANIPVNGDSEYIISMDSESKFLKVLTAGSVDKKEIKKEICDVMEGSETAFNMRSQRYQEI